MKLTSEAELCQMSLTLTWSASFLTKAQDLLRPILHSELAVSNQAHN